MILIDTTDIQATNGGTGTPDAFYNKTKLMATSKWVSTDGWRGYSAIVPEPGYKIIAEGWVTGDWSDAPSGHSESEVQEQLKKLEAEHGTIHVIYTSTSNVFSTSYTVLVKDGTPELKRKRVAHKTWLFEDGSNWRIQYHATDVISYDAERNSYTLNSGGWKTRTTKERINSYLPAGYYISQKNFEWYLVTPEATLKFEDGMEVQL